MLRFFSIFVALVFFGFALVGGDLGAKSALTGQRTLSFNTGYFTEGSNLSWSNSNAALSDFFQEMQQGHGAFFDWVAESNWAQRNRGWWLFLDGVVLNCALSSTFSTVYHEFSHWSRDKAFGYQEPYFLFGNNLDYAGINVLGFFIRQITTPCQSAACGPGKKIAFMSPMLASTPLSRFVAPTDMGGLLISAAGVNNQMRLAEDFSDMAYEKRGHLLDLMPYIENKLSSFTYPLTDSGGNDMRAVLNKYKQLGLKNIKKTHLDQSNIYSFFFSGSTYSYVLSWWNYVASGDGRVKPLEVCGFRVPDVSAYFVDDGISYRVKSAYRFDDSFYVWGAIEFIGRGHSGAEGSLGFKKTFDQAGGLTLASAIWLGHGLNANLSLRMPIKKRFFVEGLVEHFNFNSYYGQRNIPSLENGNKANAFSIRAGVTY